VLFAAEVELVDPTAVVGLVGLVLGPLAIVASGWALRKTKGESAWRSASEANAEGMRVAQARLVSANEWVKEVEGKLEASQARFVEQQKTCEALQERVDAQADHIARLLERSPEKLWEAMLSVAQAMEQHSVAAEKHWQSEEERAEHDRLILVELRKISARMDTRERSSGSG
jgi:hypothetical protein